MALARTQVGTQRQSKSAKREGKTSDAGQDERARRFVPHLAVPKRLRDDILALLVFTLAVILSLPFVGLADGTVLSWFADVLRTTFGRAAIAAPLGLSVLAVEIWRADEPQERIRRIFGGVVLVLAVVGLLALSLDNAQRSDAGGFAGELVTMLLRATIGDVGAALLLFSIGLVGVFLVTGADSATLRWYVAVLGARRRRASGSDAVGEPTSEGTEPLDFDPTRTADLPVDEGSQEFKPVEEPKPVINVRKRDTAAEEIRRAVAGVTGEFDIETEQGEERWQLPTLDLLKSYEANDPDQVDLEAKARRIEETLESFKVEAKVREIFPGPAVTLFALEPGTGVKVSKITSLQNDLALALAAPSIRIEAPVPGMARVGIEIPNVDISTVGIRDVIDSIEMKSSKAKLPIPLGRDVNGRSIIADLTRMPHVLIAGATGSGKSVCVNSIIATFLLTKTPDDLQMLLIDPKMVELVGYKNVPHLKGPIVTEMDKVVAALRMVLREMERRYQLFADLGVRNIDGYNMRREDDPSLEHLPYLVVIIDELADLMMTTPEEVETLLARLCQMARATGIHLIIATQRPSVDVLTGLIKANVPARIAFAVASLTDSRVILDMPGAERLLGSGDMLFLPPDAAKPVRVQGSYIEDQDLINLVSFWRKQQSQAMLDHQWPDFPRESEQPNDEDPLMEQALEVVKQQGTASASMLQRRLRIGYNRAARLIEAMEEDGLIGPADGPRGREVYVDDE